ncbi:NAD(P)/FAD-dependent oxidoreductase [Paracoccus sp. (in: a-proteobacteria)]|uniref:NAD(P)/FAD-dependent oxidoreductase n=1 Tax=Paracoccus sp. TaxID=267 RepID=UPI003A869EEE
MSGIFTPDFRDTPYWWDDSPLAAADPADLPAKADHVVIGSGYTGLHAALRLARAGRHVVMLDAQAIGQGCSTRNGGQISNSVKPGLAELTRRHGAETAARIIADGFASRAFIEGFVRAEGLDCGFQVCGRFHAAHSARAFAALKAAGEQQPPAFTTPVTIIPRKAQRAEIGSDYYHGGVVYHDHAAIDPGRYHRALVDLALRAGVMLVPQTRATALSPDADGATVTTTRGTIRARDVILATNGYSGALSPWHRRRIIPVGSYIIATEELPPALMDELIPKGRILSDSRRVVYYFRASPDRRRILFGGRVNAAETDPRSSARRLHAEMLRIFPQLQGTRISHSWMGFVGYSFDTLAHTGTRDRVHYAMGYCGSGVGMASYLGMKTAARLLGHGDAGLVGIPFPARPYYRGKPWFLPFAVEYYRIRDRLGW